MYTKQQFIFIFLPHILGTESVMGCLLYISLWGAICRKSIHSLTFINVAQHNFVNVASHLNVQVEELGKSIFTTGIHMSKVYNLIVVTPSERSIGTFATSHI